MYDHILPQLKVSLSALKYEHEGNVGRYQYDREGKSEQEKAAKQAIQNLEATIKELTWLSEPFEGEVDRIMGRIDDLSDRVSELESKP